MMPIKSAPTASDMMDCTIHSIGLEMRLDEIVAYLIQHELSSVVVVRQDGAKRRLLGFLSEADCLECMGNELFYGNPSPTQTAATIMRKHPTCVTPSTDLFTLTSIFTSHRFRQMPVVENDNFVGMVYRRDVLKAVDSYYRDYMSFKEHERSPIDIHQIMNHRFTVR